MKTFPDIHTLATADLLTVLQAWQGLGYNRRARFLHQAAQMIDAGAPITTHQDLIKLPGIGTNTAAAIMNYVYQIPTPFVETNIRTVYVNHFFTSHSVVTDKAILELVAQTMDNTAPRYWFWALMDYGAALKQQGKGKLHQAAAYKKQSTFVGSLRQMRGEILRRHTQGESLQLIAKELRTDPRFQPALKGLQEDGLLA